MKSETTNTIYMVDSENEGRNAIKHILAVGTDDAEFYYFYSKKSAGAIKNTITEMLKNGIQVHLIPCMTGKNAMDFQIVSYLGIMAGKNPDAEYVILSNDNGYRAAMHVLKSFGINVKIRGVIPGTDTITGDDDEEIIPADEEQDEEKTPAEADYMTYERERTIKFLKDHKVQGHNVSAVMNAAIKSKRQVQFFREYMNMYEGNDSTDRLMKEVDRADIEDFLKDMSETKTTKKDTTASAGKKTVPKKKADALRIQESKQNKYANGNTYYMQYEEPEPGEENGNEENEPAETALNNFIAGTEAYGDEKYISKNKSRLDEKIEQLNKMLGRGWTDADKYNIAFAAINSDGDATEFNNLLQGKFSGKNLKQLYKQLGKSGRDALIDSVQEPEEAD